MVKGFKDGNNKFHPITQARGVRKSRDQSIKSQGVLIRKKRSSMKIKATNLTPRELREHPLFEENTEWLDAFAETPEVIVADDRRGIFHIWFGGESHYVHQYTPDGHEFDVFSFGFDKNRLDQDEVLKMIEKTLNEDDEE